MRSLFPFFAINKSAIYLDNAATTQKPQATINAMINYYSTSCANVQRGLYQLAEDTTELFETARKSAASFINAASNQEIIFTSGTTESINLVASTWALQNLRAGDEVLITVAEHHTNLLPWQRVCKQTGAILRFMNINTETFQIDPTSCLVSSRTRLLAVTLGSNVLSGIWGHENEILTRLIAQVKAQGGAVLLDAAQVVAHSPIDVQKLCVDFLTFSGHKMFGPTGIGVLYINRAWHDRLDPYQVG